MRGQTWWGLLCTGVRSALGSGLGVGHGLARSTAAPAPAAAAATGSRAHISTSALQQMDLVDGRRGGVLARVVGLLREQDQEQEGQQPGVVPSAAQLAALPAHLLHQLVYECQLPSAVGVGPPGLARGAWADTDTDAHGAAAGPDAAAQQGATARVGASGAAIPPDQGEPGELAAALHAYLTPRGAHMHGSGAGVVGVAPQRSRDRSHAYWSSGNSSSSSGVVAEGSLDQNDQQQQEQEQGGDSSGSSSGGAPLFSWGRWGSLPAPLALPAPVDGTLSADGTPGTSAATATQQRAREDPYAPLPTLAEVRAGLAHDLSRALAAAGYKYQSPDSARSLLLLHPAQLAPLADDCGLPTAVTHAVLAESLARLVTEQQQQQQQQQQQRAPQTHPTAAAAHDAGQPPALSAPTQERWLDGIVSGAAAGGGSRVAWYDTETEPDAAHAGSVAGSSSSSGSSSSGSSSGPAWSPVGHALGGAALRTQVMRAAAWARTEAAGVLFPHQVVEWLTAAHAERVVVLAVPDNSADGLQGAAAAAAAAGGAGGANGAAHHSPGAQQGDHSPAGPSSSSGSSSSSSGSGNGSGSCQWVVVATANSQRHAHTCGEAPACLPLASSGDSFMVLATLLLSAMLLGNLYTLRVGYERLVALEHAMAAMEQRTHRLQEQSKLGFSHPLDINVGSTVSTATIAVTPPPPCHEDPALEAEIAELEKSIKASTAVLNSHTRACSTRVSAARSEAAAAEIAVAKARTVKLDLSARLGLARVAAARRKQDKQRRKDLTGNLRG
ncbi:hypothetical protein FOA52_010530 [Chlamydomonas sp. UWO 241]|nr:hypothetical protein FOA52_010530 [Chlamydomonas sp. UWO 241]